MTQAVVAVKCHPSQPLVYTACLDGAVRCWDLRTGMGSSAYAHHQFLFVVSREDRQSVVTITSSGNIVSSAMQHDINSASLHTLLTNEGELLESNGTEFVVDDGCLSSNLLCLTLYCFASC